MELVATLSAPLRPLPPATFGKVFDGLVLLHRGQAAEAVEVLADVPETFETSASGLWRAWYVAAWAEAAVLAGLPEAADRVRRAAALTGGNPVAEALVRRASALAGCAGDGAGPRRPRRRGLRPPHARRALPVGAHPGHARRPRRGRGPRRAGPVASRPYGLASTMRLNGVLVATRTWEKPASRSTCSNRSGPACAPSPSPTSWARDDGVQITVDSP